MKRFSRWFIQPIEEEKSKSSKGSEAKTKHSSKHDKKTKEDVKSKQVTGKRQDQKSDSSHTGKQKSETERAKGREEYQVSTSSGLVHTYKHTHCRVKNVSPSTKLPSLGEYAEMLAEEDNMETEKPRQNIQEMKKWEEADDPTNPYNLQQYGDSSDDDDIPDITGKRKAKDGKRKSTLPLISPQEVEDFINQDSGVAEEPAKRNYNIFTPKRTASSPCESISKKKKPATATPATATLDDAEEPYTIKHGIPMSEKVAKFLEEQKKEEQKKSRKVEIHTSSKKVSASPMAKYLQGFIAQYSVPETTTNPPKIVQETSSKVDLFHADYQPPSQEEASNDDDTQIVHDSDVIDIDAEDIIQGHFDDEGNMVGLGDNFGIFVPTNVMGNIVQPVTPKVHRARKSKQAAPLEEELIDDETETIEQKKEYGAKAEASTSAAPKAPVKSKAKPSGSGAGKSSSKSTPTSLHEFKRRRPQKPIIVVEQNIDTTNIPGPVDSSQRKAHFFYCSRCSFHTKDRTYLRRHDTRQCPFLTTVERLICPEEGCGAQFIHDNNYNDHISSHTGVCKWECDRCGKKYMLQNQYARHIKTCKVVK